MLVINIVKLCLLGYSALVAAHPGHEEAHATRGLLAYKAHMRRGLEKCAVSLDKSGLNARSMVRRAEIANSHYRHGLSARDTDTVLNTTHLSTAGYTPSTPESEIFGNSNACTLNPEGETGPYFVNGEHIRTDALEDQPGVPVILEFQFVDAQTCQPIPQLYADIWSCNATGVYSGLVAMGNGNSDDESNMNTTFLRALGETDADGVVTFKTLFPGHYSGRTTHTHVVAHLNATVLANTTLSGGTVPHVGQLFWDQDLINDVEATYPYNTNDVTLTTNAEDRVFSTETTDTTSDPVINYVYLGENLSDGLFGWVTIAVNQSATYSPAYSYVWTSSGSEAVSGHSDENVNGGGGGQMPSGGFPSGVPTPA